MYLVCTDPDNYDMDYKEEMIHVKSLVAAKQQAAKMAGFFGKTVIYKLERMVMPVGETPTQTYTINDKGEVLPCD